MRWSGFTWQLAAGLRHRLAKLSEQEGQPADDIGPVQGGRMVPQRSKSVEMNQAVAED
jgi:hypothetical protein